MAMLRPNSPVASMFALYNETVACLTGCSLHVHIKNMQFFSKSRSVASNLLEMPSFPTPFLAIKFVGLFVSFRLNFKGYIFNMCIYTYVYIVYIKLYQ